MQGQIKIVKITSKKFPEKEWDSVENFSNYHDDRQIVKNEKKARKTSSIRYNELIKNLGYFTKTFVSDNKKYIIKLEIADSRIHDYHMDNWIKPHVDKGILECNELFLFNIDINKTKSLIEILDSPIFEGKLWETILKKIN